MEKDKVNVPNWFEKQSAQFDQSRIGVSVLLIILQSCIGSMAAAFYTPENISLVTSAATVTMGSNALFISQAPAKWCIAMFYISVVVNSILIVGYLLSLF